MKGGNSWSFNRKHKHNHKSSTRSAPQVLKVSVRNVVQAVLITDLWVNRD